MKSQKPAEGILVRGEWPDAKAYKVICACGDDVHEHNVWVEAEDTGVNVNVYITVKSPVWSMNRWRQIWTLITKGYLQHETILTMSEQQALNYADSLTTAVEDLKKLSKAKK